MNYSTLTVSDSLATSWWESGQSVVCMSISGE